MQKAEGLGLNAQGIVANAPSARIDAIATSVSAGHPTYITQEVAGIAEQYSFLGEGPLVRVWPRGAAEFQSPEHTLELAMAGGDLHLVGYDLALPAEAGGPTIRITLYWQPQIQLSQSYKLSLRLLDTDMSQIVWPEGEPVVEDRFPLRQVAPTTTWLPGEVVRDVHYLRIPGATRNERTHLQIILYDATTVMEAGRVLIPIIPQFKQVEWHNRRHAQFALR